MKILHIVPAAPYGGAQKIAKDLAHAQANAGLNVALLWTGTPAPRSGGTSVDGVDTRIVAGALLKKCLVFRRVLREIAPDVVHLHMSPPWVMPFLPYRKAATIVHLHSVPFRPKSPKGYVGNLMQSIVFRRADVLLPVSRWVEKQWRPHYPHALYELVFNGVPNANTEARAPFELRNKTPRVGFATRLDVDKGVEEFVEFAMALHKLCPQVEFLIAGDGPLRARIEEKTSQLARNGCITFLGFVEDMPGYWSKIDLAVFCAEKEPFGLRLIEPVAHGVPVVAYRTGAGSDEIIDVCSAVADVPYGQPQALAELATSLLSDDRRREAMIEAGKEQVNANFSLAAMSRRVDQAYAVALQRVDTKHRYGTSR